jgi:hypothetical protein
MGYHQNNIEMMKQTKQHQGTPRLGNLNNNVGDYN